MSDMDNIYDQVAGAKATGGGVYIVHGDYTFLIKKVWLDRGYKGISFKAELEVVRSSPLDILPGLVADGEQVGPSTPNKPGTTVTYVVNLSKPGKEGASAFGNVKAFLLAGDGSTEAEFGVGVGADGKPKDPAAEFKNFMRTACSGSNPLRGVLISDRTYRVPIQSGKNAGKPFTGHNWAHVPGQNAESVKANRAALAAKAAAAG